MQQNQSRTPWIVCGVIVVMLLCGGIITLVGGFGLLAMLSDESDNQATPQVASQATKAPLSPIASTPLTGQHNSAGSQIPFEAVVQIIAMVDIDNELIEGWTGSGSIISADGLILTNGHVVLSDRYYQVDHLVVALTQQQDEQPVPTYIAEVLQVDEALDIAVIRVEADLAGNPLDRSTLNLPTVPLGNANDLNLGDPLVIMGYPSIGGSTITLTRGEVAGFTSEPGYGNRAFVKTSATISGGNSGGLAANASGELIGIPTQLGYGGDDQYVDCRVLADTNRDGAVDDSDSCVPTGGFINALRPITLAMPYIQAAQRGEVNIQVGVQAEQSEPPPQSSKVYWKDDFSDESSGWAIDSSDTSITAYIDGEYHMGVIPTEWLSWSYMEDPLENVIISVETRVVSPSSDGDYGIICRYQDEANFYGLEVSEDGYFTIWKYQNNEFIELYEWTFTETIPAGQPFRIDAACTGDRFRLAVNDTLLADVTDGNPLPAGGYGLVVGTYSTGGFTVAFDNFTVYEP